MKQELSEKIVDAFCFEDFYFENLCIEIPDGMFKTLKREYELIVCNPKRIIFFVQLSDDASDYEIVALLRAALNTLANKISVSLNNFVVCGTNSSQMYIFNKYNDRLFKVDLAKEDDIFDFLEGELYGSEIFDVAFLSKIKDMLSFSSSVIDKSASKEKVKYTSDGKMLVKKHGLWRETSELNSDKLFALTALGGMLGIHLFYQKKPGKAIAYLLTLGFFGFGWFFDCLEIFFGIYKDPTGRYLAPLQNRVFAILFIFIGAAIFCGAYFVWTFMLGLLPKAIQYLFNMILG